MDMVLYALGALAVVGGAAWAASARVVQQVERGVVFRLGRAQPAAPLERGRLDLLGWGGPSRR